MGIRLRVLLAATATAAGLVCAPLGPAGADVPSGTDTVERGRDATVRVASFNVRSVTKSPASRAGQLWSQRRGAVIRQILRERLDVVGVQEASQNSGYRSQLVDGRNQFLDLRNGLRKAGGRWGITSPAAYNCVRAYSSANCRYKDRGASRTTKILFNKDKVEKIRSGSYEYRHQSGGDSDERYLVWAVFEDRSSNERFFFANTHLSNGSGSLQKQQWHELIDKVNHLKNGLPVIVVGDFQRSRMKNPVTDMLAAMKSAGYGDVLGQRPNEPMVKDPRAHRTQRSWVNSMNGFQRDVRDFAFEDNKERAGNFIDWIFASNRLPVRQYEVVADIDPDTMRLRGVIPSDHNMVRASIVLR